MRSSFVGYIKNDRSNEAITLFREIKHPNDIILNLLFNACAQLGTENAFNLAKNVFEASPKDVHSNVYVFTSMLSASMKCGDVAYAESLFNKSSKRNLAIYATMMKGNNTKFVTFI